jgi:DNA-binding response OmpR family regulator
MTTKHVHIVAGGRRRAQTLVADRNRGEGEIAVRAIQRLSPQLEVQPVVSLDEAESALAGESVATVFVASGLDERTHWQTIRWFAGRAGSAVVIALLESCSDLERQEALEAGASYLCSKPELLVAQLRREAESRLAQAAPECPRHASEYRWGQ